MKIIKSWGAALDKDNCLYRNPSDYPRMFDETAVHALTKYLNGMPEGKDFETLVKEAQDSYRETGSPVVKFSEQYGIQLELLEAYRHKLMPHNTISPILGLPSAFRRGMKRGHKYNLTTHCHQNLGRRTIPHMGLAEIFFEESNIVTLDQVGYQHMKHRSPEMVIRAAKNMGLELKDMAFFEDSKKNFTPIKDHDHRVKTVLITWGQYVQKTSEIDFMFRDPLEALNAMQPPKRKTMVFMGPG